MSRRSRRRASVATREKANPNYTVVMSGPSALPQMMPRNMKAYLQEGYRNKTAFRVVRQITSSAAGIKWKHYYDKSKQREYTSSPLLELWDRPNKEMGGSVFRQNMLGYYCLTGNSYMLGINTSQNPKAPFDELHVLRPDLTRVHISEQLEVDYYEFGPAYPYRRYDKPFIMHSKLFAANDDVYGLSPVEVAAMLVDIQKAGQKWNLGLMSNMAAPSGAWVTKEILSDPSYKSLKKEIHEKFSGPRNAREPVILHGGVQWQSMSMTPLELDFLNSDDKTDRDIAGIFFNFPVFLLGLSDTTFNNQSEAKHYLYTDICFPILDAFVDDLNMWLTPRYGGWLDYDREDVETIQERIQAGKAQMSDRATAEFTSGTTTFLEARELQGKEPLPVKDFVFVKDVPVHVADLDEYIAGMSGKVINPPPPPAPLLLPPTTVTEEPNADDQSNDGTDGNKHGRHNQSTHGRRRTFKDGLAGMSIKEKETFLAKNGGDAWIDAISTKEYKAVQKYTSDGYKKMNKALRTGGKETDEIKLCQAALLQSKAPVHMTVTRGYGHSTLDQFKEAAKSGGYFKEKGFVSTTIKDTAQYDGHTVNIKVFKGAPGAYVDPISQIGGEKEFLIPHGAEFKVTKATENKDGTWTFDVEYKGTEFAKSISLQFVFTKQDEEDNTSDTKEGMMSDKFVSQKDDIIWLDKKIEDDDQEDDDGKSQTISTKVLDLSTAEEKEAYFKSVETRREKWEETITARLQAYFKTEQKAIIAVVEQSNDTDGVETRVSHAVDTLGQSGVLKHLIVQLYQDVGTDSGQAVLSELKSEQGNYSTKDDTSDVLNLYAPDVLVYLLSMSSEKVTQINDYTKALLQSALEEGVSAGESIIEITKRVDDLYLQQIIPNRSQTISATEVHSAVEYGTMMGGQAAASAGLQLRKVWLATADAHTRPDHVRANGQEVDLEEPFMVGGEKLSYPGDPAGSAGNIIKCRCTHYFVRVKAEDVNKALHLFIQSLPQTTVTREQYRELLKVKS